MIDIHIYIVTHIHCDGVYMDTNISGIKASRRILNHGFVGLCSQCVLQEWFGAGLFSKCNPQKFPIEYLESLT